MQIDIGKMYWNSGSTGYRLYIHGTDNYFDINVTYGSDSANLLYDAWESIVNAEGVVVTYSDGWRRIQYGGYVITVDACNTLRDINKRIR